MKILVISQYFWPENFRINDLVQELVQRGHEVFVLTGLPNYPSGSVDPNYKKSPKDFQQYKGAQIIRVPMIPRKNNHFFLICNYLSYAFSASTIGVWKLRKLQFDIIFVNQLSPVLVGIPAIFLKKIKCAPIVFWVLDLWPQTLQAIGILKSEKAVQFAEKLVGQIYQSCDLILSQSKSFISKITKYSGNEVKIEYFPSWSDVDMSFKSVDFAPEIPIKQGVFNLMFTGNIGKAQDFSSILDAAELLKEFLQIRWLILGDGSMAQWVRQEILRRNLQETFFMLGAYPLERMPSFFKHADALLLTLKDETIFSMTIPAKLQSYLSSGLPIITMANGEVANIVENAHVGVNCPAGDAAGLSKAVLSIVNMDSLQRAHLGNNGLALSKKHFDGKHLMDQLESWMHKLVKTNPRRI
jgi:glycosyltransferase involved in cell wall biosynthesis